MKARRYAGGIFCRRVILIDKLSLRIYTQLPGVERTKNEIR